jgi:peptidoglycan hydrolase-like protein with peptidoglycan-binding domain
MSLSSPRFRNEPKLQAVAGGSRALKNGVKGRDVHLVQMALIDLGYSLPLSTRNSNFSPDGIYGRETSEAIRLFQLVTPFMSVTGEVGRETMRALDACFPTFTHQLNLHFRSLSLSDVPFNNLMTGLERVYAPSSIEARFASGESLRLSAAEQSRFNVVRQDCAWGVEHGRVRRPRAIGHDGTSHGHRYLYRQSVPAGERARLRRPRRAKARVRYHPQLRSFRSCARSRARASHVGLLAGSYERRPKPDVSDV